VLSMTSLGRPRKGRYGARLPASTKARRSNAGASGLSRRRVADRMEIAKSMDNYHRRRTLLALDLTNKLAGVSDITSEIRIVLVQKDLWTKHSLE